MQKGDRTEPAPLGLLTNFLYLSDVKQVDRLWVLLDHFSLFVLLFNDRHGLECFLALFDLVSVSMPLLEGETVGLRIVVIRFFLAPAGQDLFLYGLCGVH